MMDGDSIFGKAIGLSVGNTIIQVLIHYSNAQALALVNSELLQN